MNTKNSKDKEQHLLCHSERSRRGGPHGWTSEPTCHGEATHQQANVPAPNYDGFPALLCTAAVFGFPGSPYSNSQY